MKPAATRPFVETRLVLVIERGLPLPGWRWTRELALEYGVKHLTLKRWCQRGQLRLRRKGRLLMVDPEQLRAFLATGTQKSTARQRRGAPLRWDKPPAWPQPADAKPAPAAPAYTQQTPELAWWLSVLMAGRLPANDIGPRGPSATACPITALFDDYALRMGVDVEGKALRTAQTRLGAFLRQVVPQLSTVYRSRGGHRFTIYLFPQLDACRALFDERSGSGRLIPWDAALAWSEVPGPHYTLDEQAKSGTLNLPERRGT